MEDRYLFRAKRTDNEEWIEGLPSYDINGNLTEFEVYRGFANCEIADVDSETVCQYTGLTDKNGRKIFEGDIITYQHDNDDCPFPNKDTKRRVGRVYFQEFRSCFAVAEGRNGSDMINQDLFKYVQNGNRVQVIGNIFDNPDLLPEEDT